MNILSTKPIIKRGNNFYRGTEIVYKILCTTCGASIFRANQGYKSFCSLECKQINREPKSSTIMSLADKEPDSFYYLIGLIATDGHIGHNSSYCEIRLSVYDDSSIKLLSDIQQIFGGKVCKEGNGIVWSIYSIHFHTFLKNIGFTSNKSLTLNLSKWFNSLNESYKWSFMRGVIDGDGSINTKFKNLCIVSSSIHFTKMVSNFLRHTNDKVYTYKIKSKNPCWKISVNGKNVLPILDMVYTNNPQLFLERKHIQYGDYTRK